MNAFSESPVQRALGLESLIRDHADEADRESRLSRPVAEALASNGLYRLAAPVAFGGEEADPMTQIQTIETVSQFDGATGWNLMIGIETFGLISGGCESCRHLIDDPAVIMCSSTAAKCYGMMSTKC